MGWGEHAGQVLPAAVTHPGHRHRERVSDRDPCTIREAAAEPAPEMRFATVAEVAALADAIPPRFRALVMVAAYTGLRWGELAGLRVKRVDLLHRRITV